MSIRIASKENSTIESAILQKFTSKFPTLEAQQTRLAELVGIFGNLLESEIKFVTGDILCLAKMVFEGGKQIVLQLRRQILDPDVSPQILLNSMA